MPHFCRIQGHRKNTIAQKPCIAAHQTQTQSSKTRFYQQATALSMNMNTDTSKIESQWNQIQRSHVVTVSASVSV